MAQRGMGCGRLSERALRSTSNRQTGRAALYCNFDGTIGSVHDDFSVLPSVGDSRTAIRIDGFGARYQRGRHEYWTHGTGAFALYGTRTEYLLLCRNTSEIGRASCRERVELLGVSVRVQKV